MEKFKTAVDRTGEVAIALRDDDRVRMGQSKGL
ncbi:hypothetical protein V475_19670 [Sphingobium baderi LL03]|uniref:Uncharacterized protein n=1 Tax=Sphingobium baderi LL03 TaxID=1114964 RepID=T0I0C4_9SPHN|nr:hypothetical protein L485_02925 [Sphingobium baderi LL03]KMS60087.1 hypothetical protein V475_19670 [Sphingobium baderi LL03]